METTVTVFRVDQFKLQFHHFHHHFFKVETMSMSVYFSNYLCGIRILVEVRVIEQVVCIYPPWSCNYLSCDSTAAEVTH